MLEGNKCLEKDVVNRTEQSTKGLISNRLVKVALVEEMRTEQGKQFLSLLIRQICTEHLHCRASCYFRAINKTEGFPDGSDGKEPACHAGDPKQNTQNLPLCRGGGAWRKLTSPKVDFKVKEPVLCLVQWKH